MTADPRDEDPPGLAMEQVVVITLLVLCGIGFTAYELLGLSPDDLGGGAVIAGGAAILLLVLKVILLR